MGDSDLGARHRTGDLYDSWFTHVDRYGVGRALGELATEDRGWGCPPLTNRAAHFVAGVVLQELSSAMQRVDEVSRKGGLPTTTADSLNAKSPSAHTVSRTSLVGRL